MTMPNRIPNIIDLSAEICIAIITVVSTMLAGELFLKFIVGIATYTSARLFYDYHGHKVKRITDNLTMKFKRLRKNKKK